MDWSRAKSVLIISFLVLNIVLGYQLWTDLRDRLDTGGELSQQTLELMQQKDILLLGNVPDKAPELSNLEYRFTTTPGEPERVELETPVESRIIFSEDELRDGLGDIIPELDHYAYDPEISTTDVFVLYWMADGLPMFDVELRLYIQDQQIIAYSQDRVEQVQPDGAMPQQVLSASEALQLLIENTLQPGTVIQEIRLGYHGQMFDSEDQYSAPSWRVLLQDEPLPYYVHGVSAEVSTETEPTSGDTEQDPMGEGRQ
ncbi:two-component system regulatory protein YycI [Paenibacillus sp. IB182496]|uniref:Two-component system regulatory protein YycI n=1 Tax=Paenibacillus sabuli TaxID=2772509 RepID=A0A927BTC1_9BACL|nr:two-component system regulatory protein YycI [Paenibacillus sabuli]MBD2846418.1 two-component system regulatory protein YycI [Paenibacillus sabuli]